MSMSGPIQEKNHSHAIGVESVSAKKLILQNMNKHIQLE